MTSAGVFPLDVVALNDVVFEKLARDRQASIAVYASGRLFASYSADALIVASSTGSTAYSFSAGGPIVSPGLDALVVTPVAQQMVFNRSLVLAACDERVGVRVRERSGQVAVSVDGQLRACSTPAIGSASMPNPSGPAWSGWPRSTSSTGFGTNSDSPTRPAAPRTDLHPRYMTPARRYLPISPILGRRTSVSADFHAGDSTQLFS
jgi:ATP-NAD kinase C-terminal domain